MKVICCCVFVRCSAIADANPSRDNHTVATWYIENFPIRKEHVLQRLVAPMFANPAYHEDY